VLDDVEFVDAVADTGKVAVDAVTTTCCGRERECRFPLCVFSATATDLVLCSPETATKTDDGTDNGVCLPGAGTVPDGDGGRL